MVWRQMLLTALLSVLVAGEVGISPLMQRVELAPTSTTIVTINLTAAPGTKTVSIVTDCACLRSELSLPAVVPDTGVLSIPLRASGVRPGIEGVTIHTTAGARTATIQIVGPGAGEGRATLTSALHDCRSNRWSLWGIVHDLNGHISNCSCSTGSLGGVGLLARLPAFAAQMDPAVPARWILSGDIEGTKQGLAAALGERGWSLHEPAVALTADPLGRLSDPAVTVVIPILPTTTEHRKILRPVLTGGLTVELLLIDDQRQIRAHRILPVDRTLDDDPAFVARFPDPLTKVVTTVQPSESCRECHSATVDHWAGTRHALAYARLPEASRTDTCITCHTLPLSGKAVAPGVHCQSCHNGSAEHVASRGTTRTTGSMDCRSCHDARHHPGFDRAKLWEVIRHGR